MSKVTIAFSELEYALSSDNGIGFCLACCAENYGCEPDARNYRCDECDELEVFGAEEILIMGRVYYD